MEKIRVTTDVVVELIAAILLLFIPSLFGMTGLMQMVVAYAGFMIVFGVIYLSDYRSRTEKQTFVFSNIIWVVLFAFATHGIAQIILYLLQKLMPTQISYYSRLITMIVPTKDNMWLIILATCVMAPIAEELLFRGCIYGKMRQGYSKFLALFVTTALFSAYHMNLTQVLYTIPFGIAAAIIYEKTKTIWTCILFHFIFNGSAFLLKAQGTVMTVFMLISIPLFVICLIKLRKTRRC